MSLKRRLALLSLPSLSRTSICSQCRNLHRLNAPNLRIPKPTPFVSDVQAFLTLIGRGLSQHAAKIPSWEALFTLSSQQLKESGVEPARARRYLLWWRERFRNGIVGVGGDLENVKNGVAELTLVEVPSKRGIDQVATVSKSAGMRKMIVNMPPAAAPEDKDASGGVASAAVVRPAFPQVEPSEAKPVAGMKILSGDRIAGTGVQPVKGRRGVVALKVQEGLWEQRRGHKVDGGERRKAMVRAKRRAQQKRDAR